MNQAKILIVEDEGVVAADLENRLTKLGYAVSGVAASGAEAIQEASKTKPDLVLMDIMLAGEIDGIQAAEEIRRRFLVPLIYLTANSNRKILERAKITEPLGYLLKPFMESELQANVEIALYKHEIDREREELIQQLREALARVKTLSGLLPICASCKNIRDDKGYWNRVEAYIEAHSQATFSHGICPDCAKRLYPDYFGKQ